MEKKNGEKKDDEEVKDEDCDWVKFGLNLYDYKCIFKKFKEPI